MLMPGRNSDSTYRFGFNGKENLNDVKGVGKLQDYGERIYDPRLGKWLSIDPLYMKYPSLSPYQYCANNPVFFVDRDGKKIFINYVDEKGNKASFEYKPKTAPINNEFVMKAVQALDRIYQVGDIAIPGTPSNVIFSLAFSKAADVNINGNAVDAFDDETKASATPLSATITWASEGAVYLVDNSGNLTGQAISPTTALSHEIAHAYDFLTDWNGTVSRLKTPVGYYNNEEEKNVTKFENTIAQYYGEGVRQNHTGVPYRTDQVGNTRESVTEIKITDGAAINLKPVEQ